MVSLSLRPLRKCNKGTFGPLPTLLGDYWGEGFQDTEPFLNLGSAPPRTSTWAKGCKMVSKGNDCFKLDTDIMNSPAHLDSVSPMTHKA